MNAQEATLIILMQNFKTKYQRVLALEKYVQHFGALSQESGNKAKELISECDA